MPQKRTLKTHWTFVLEEKHMETIKGPSMTVPDETMSIRELLDKHTRGMRVTDSLYREASFDSSASFDSDDIEKIRHLDLFEREEYSRNLAERMKKFEAEIEADRKKQAELLRLEKEELDSLKTELRNRKKESERGRGEATDAQNSPIREVKPTRRSDEGGKPK